MSHTKDGSTFTEVVLETFRLNGALLEAGNELLRDLGLTSARWQVLGSLVEGPLTVAGIARQMGLSRQNVQRIANRLIQDGFIGTSPNPAHRRAKLHFLTDYGLESMREVNKRQEDWVNEISKDLDFARLNQTVEALIDCRKRVDNSLEGIRQKYEK
ncbi:MAG: MarR family winged helix-turn-helix transcriptional regulator [Desulforhopalus sp.]